MRIIFIPGLLCTQEVWGQLNTLRNKYLCQDADVVSLSNISEMGDLLINDLPSDDDFVLIGISMGGYVALDVAIKMKDKLKKLILINTTAKPVDEITVPDRKKAIQLAEQGKMDQVLQMSKGACYFEPKNEWISLEEKMANEIGAQSFVRQQQAIIERKDYSNLLKNINADTLIISGKSDKVISFQDSIQMFEQITNANLVLLNACGHLSSIEKSAIVTECVFKFLET